MDTQDLSRLAAIDFGPDISRLTEDFVGREWVFAEIDAWLADPVALQVSNQITHPFNDQPFRMDNPFGRLPGKRTIAGTDENSWPGHADPRTETPAWRFHIENC